MTHRSHTVELHEDHGDGTGLFECDECGEQMELNLDDMTRVEAT